MTSFFSVPAEHLFFNNDIIIILNREYERRHSLIVRCCDEEEEEEEEENKKRMKVLTCKRSCTLSDDQRVSRKVSDKGSTSICSVEDKKKRGRCYLQVKEEEKKLKNHRFIYRLYIYSCSRAESIKAKLIVRPAFDIAPYILLRTRA